MTKRTALAAAAALLALPAAAAPPAELQPVAAPPAELKLAAAAAAGYRANIDAFDAYVCHYTVTAGFAATPADAMAGKFSRPPQTALFSLAKDGKELCLHETEDAQTTADQAKPPALSNSLGLPGVLTGQMYFFGTSAEVSGGKKYLLYTPRFATANIGDVDSDRYAGNRNPLAAQWVGVRTGRGLAGVVEPGFAGTVLSAAATTAAGGPALSVVVRGVQSQTAYTVDPASGYLPSDIVFQADGEKGALRIAMTESKACSKGRYFPTRLVSCTEQFIPAMNGKPAHANCIVFVHQVTSLDADRRPTKAEMEVTLPAGTVVCRPKDLAKYFTTRQQEQAGPGDLEAIADLTARKPVEPLADTAVRPARRPWWLYALGVVPAAVAVLLVLKYRRDSRRA